MSRLDSGTRHALAHWKPNEVYHADARGELHIRVTQPFDAEVTIPSTDILRLVREQHIYVRWDKHLPPGAVESEPNSEWITGEGAVHALKYQSGTRSKEFMRTARQQRYKNIYLKVERDGFMPAIPYLHELRLSQPSNGYRAWRSWCETLGDNKVDPPPAPSLLDLRMMLTDLRLPASYVRWALACHQVEVSSDQKQLVYRDPEVASQEAIALAQPLFAALNAPDMNAIYRVRAGLRSSPAYMQFAPHALMTAVTREHLHIQLLQKRQLATWVNDTTLDITILDDQEAQDLCEKELERIRTERKEEGLWLSGV